MRPYFVGLLAVSVAACGADRAIGPSHAAVAESRSAEQLVYRPFDGVLVIDGVRYEAESDQARALASIKADQIARVDVMKGALAEQHGVTGGRGLIVVTLKKTQVKGS